MKTTMSALAALALIAGTDVRAKETVGNTVRLAGSKDAKVTVVYQHALPGIPGKSVKGVEYSFKHRELSRDILARELSVARRRFRQVTSKRA